MSVLLPFPTEDLVESDEISGITPGEARPVATISLPRQRTQGFRDWLILLIVVATAAVFWKVLNNDFLLWDDDINITGNPHLGSLTGERLQWIFTDYSYTRRYMPFGWLTWCAIYELAGLSSFAFHAVNLLFHIANAVLIFIFLRQLPGLRNEPEDTPSRRASRNGCVAAGTLFWALHPMRVEIVAWASGLLYAQALCCLLIAWLCFLKAQNHSANGWKRRAWQLTSLAAYGGSLLTYPIGLGAVAVFAVLSLLPFLQRAERGWELRAGGWRKALLETAPYFLLAMLVLGATLFASAHASGQWTPPKTIEQFGLPNRAMQVLYIFGHYVWKPWVPVNLCAVNTTLIGFDPWSLRFVLHALFVVGVTGLLIKVWRRAPFLLALWGCYLALLAPVSGPTVSPHFPSDRYGYIVTLMWSVLLAALLQRVWEDHRQWWLPAMTIALAVLFGAVFLTSSYLPTWKDSGTFFRYNASRINRLDYRTGALYRLGRWHGLRGEWRLAQTVFQEGLRQMPEDVNLNTDYGIALGATGQREAAEQQFEHALQLNPQNVLAHQYLGVLAKERGNLERYEIHREAADRLRARHMEETKQVSD